MSQASEPIELARDLVRCRSITPAEGGALGILEARLKGAGFTVHRVTFVEPGTAPVENLYARVGTAAPNLMFAGHTDVVPPGDEAKWSYPPFASVVSDGTLYGRGTVDMKGAVACAVAAAIDHVAARGTHRRGSISFLITGDEEGIAVNGTVKLLRWAAERGETFDHCILGEPSSAGAIGDMIKVGRRGSLNGTLVVAGQQGHVAYPKLADNPIRSLTALMSALMAQPLDQGSAHFEPSNLEFTSVDVGNPVVNLIPGEARARFNIRFNECHSQTSLRALVEARLRAAAGPRIAWHVDWQPSNADSFLAKPGPFLDLVRSAIGDVTGNAPELSTTGGTSDARFIKNYCPVLELGLVGRTMHQIDECTSLTDLQTLAAVYRKIIDRYFG